MAKEVTLNPIQSIELENQSYNSSDTSLISSFDNETFFKTGVDFVEYFVYSRSKTLLNSNYRHSNFKVTTEGILLDPVADLESTAYSVGSYYTIYNFVRPLLNSSYTSQYYISEISTDRTEIRLESTTIAPSLIIDGVTDLEVEIANTAYYRDFYINFGNNELIIANNVALDLSRDTPSVLIKLYEALPSTFDLKAQCWAVDKISDSVAYALTIQTILQDLDPKVYLRTPNFNIPASKEVNNSTEYQSISTLYTGTTGSLTSQLKSLLTGKGVNLNIDYTEFNNFVFFSSAERRLENFAYKLELIETYTANSRLGTGVIPNPSISSSQNLWANKVEELITSFDGYEYYLYSSSGSKAWPKVSSEKPYENISTDSTIATAWLTAQLASASYYDQENQNALRNTIPNYLVEDSSNANYVLFVDMIGQHFDTLYSYTEALTEKYNTDNRAQYGLSKDLVADALRDLGVKLYESNLTDLNLYNTYLGIDPDGNPSVNTGSEVITNLVIPTLENTSGSYTTGFSLGYDTFYSSSDAPLDALNLLTTETYKRLYHNLPYLLKKKGTVEGLSVLINCFGIPDTLLQLNQYGNQDKEAVEAYTYWRDFSNYSAEVSRSGYVEAPWLNLTPTNITPKTVQFRFKTKGIPTQYSESLLTVSTGSNYLGSQQFAVVLEYTGSGNSSGSYEGSIADPYREYGTLKLLDLVNNVSTSVYLPVYDGNWWSVMLTEKSEGVNYLHTLYVKNKINTGEDGNTLGFQASGSTFGTAGWINQGYSGSNTGGLRLGNNTSISLLAKTYTAPLAAFQELRYYTVPLSESAFDAYVMNPTSIEGNSLTGSNTALNTLLFRAPLGTDLQITTSSATYTSLHPATSTIPTTASFRGPLSVPVNSYRYVGVVDYVDNKETLFYHQPNTGLRAINNSRIKQASSALPGTGSNIVPSNTLSAYRRIEQTPYSLSPASLEENTGEIAFSPQNEINKDIINQLGYFNIGEYIGDPRQIRDNKYTQLETLKREYFSKYTSRYNYKDYIRLIRYYNNLLFKMIKDFTPARSNLTTGVVIKQTILERDKYVTPLPTYEDVQLTASISPFPYTSETGSLQQIGADSGGVYNNLTSSFTQSIRTPEGLIIVQEDTNKEFYTGELNDTKITVTTQSLQSNPLLSSSFTTTISNHDKIVFGEYIANINNINASRLSRKYFDVDYNLGEPNPLNLEGILNGTSTFAEVQDSNYNPSSSYAKIRYVGKQQTVDGINTGKEIVVGQQRSYIAYYDWAGSTLAERSGSANFHIGYLIDEEGNLAQPTVDLVSSAYLANLTQNFSERSRVSIVTYKPQLQGVGTENRVTTTVHRPAKILQTILYSDTGSNGLPYLGTGYKTSLNFEIPRGYYPNPYKLNVEAGSDGPFTGGSESDVPFDQILQDEAESFNTSSYRYVVEKPGIIKASFTASVRLKNIGVLDSDLRVAVYKQAISSSIIEQIGYNLISAVTPGSSPDVIATGSTYLNEGDQIWVEGRGTPYDWEIVGGSFVINPILTASPAGIPYWTGSTTTTVLTSSIQLGEVYGAYKQTPVTTNGTGSGFSDPQLFTIEPFDEIRFEGLEAESYTILSSSFDPSGPKVYLHLDRPLNTLSTNIQYFSIRRFIEDPGFLIIESPDVVSPIGPGFILPEFMSDKLQANYSNIIKDFAQKNLI